MGMYDDGGIDFAQGQFDASRERNKQEAKKQEKFSKAATAFSTLAKGGNYLINLRADTLESNQAFKKASYETHMTRAENLRTQDAERLKTGVSRLDFLTNNIYTKMMEQYETDNPYADFGIARKSFRAESQKIAKTRLPEYEEMMNTANNFGSFEDFDKEYSKASKIPRSLFGWMTGGIKNIVKGETPESLKYKAGKATDALYGTGLFDKFKNLEDSYKAYDRVATVPVDIAGILKRAEDASLIKGKILTDKVEIEDNLTESRGVITNQKVLIIPRISPKDGTISVESEVVHTSTSRAKDAYLDPKAIKEITDQVKPEYREELTDIIYTNGDPLQTNADLALQFVNQNPSYLAIDWTDENSKTKAFPTWYNTQIKYAKIPNSKKGKYDAKEISIARETAVKGIYEVDPDYKDEAKALGLDEASALESFNKYGIKATLGNRTYLNAGTALTVGKLVNDGYNDITKNLTAPQTTAWNNMQSDFGEMFINQINKGKEAYDDDPSKVLTLLDDDFDFNQSFDGFDLPGTYSIYRNNEDSSIFIKAN